MSDFSEKMKKAKTTYLENELEKVKGRESVSIDQIVNEVSIYIQKNLIKELEQGRIRERKVDIGVIFHKYVPIKYVSIQLHIRFEEGPIRTVDYYPGGEESCPSYSVHVINIVEVQTILKMLVSKLESEKIVCREWHKLLDKLKWNAKYMNNKIESCWIDFECNIE